MAALAVRVRSVVMGAPAESAPMREVSLELASERVKVRELIARAVARQIEVLRAERRDDEAVAAALRRQYLTPSDVEVQGAEGRVALSRPRATKPLADARTATLHAWAAFRKGVFRVLIEGRPVSDLDEEVTLRPTTKVTFFRLVPLAGG